MPSALLLFSVAFTRFLMKIAKANLEVVLDLLIVNVFHNDAKCSTFSIALTRMLGFKRKAITK